MSSRHSTSRARITLGELACIPVMIAIVVIDGLLLMGWRV